MSEQSGMYVEGNTVLFKDKRTVLDKVTGLLFNWFYRKVECELGEMKKDIAFKVSFKEWNNKAVFVLPADVVMLLCKSVTDDMKVSKNGCEFKVNEETTIIIPLRFAKQFLRELEYMGKMVVIDTITKRLLKGMPNEEGEGEPAKEPPVLH